MATLLCEGREGQVETSGGGGGREGGGLRRWIERGCEQRMGYSRAERCTTKLCSPVCTAIRARWLSAFLRRPSPSSSPLSPTKVHSM